MREIERKKVERQKGNRERRGREPVKGNKGLITTI